MSSRSADNRMPARLTTVVQERSTLSVILFEKFWITRFATSDLSNPCKMSSTEAAGEVSTAASVVDTETQCNTLIEEGKKALALQEWEKAVEKYADALEIRREQYGELSPLLAPLLLSYGKALFEVAVSQQGVMGKATDEAAPINAAAGTTTEASSSKIHFEGEGVDVQEGDDEDEDQAAEGGEDGEDEPEDDFNEAWQVLDLARTLFEKKLEDEAEGEEKTITQKNLAECLSALADVSLETENFPQAAEDYKASLAAFSTCLPFESREIASAHFKLAVVLESVANGREDALRNIEKAIESVKARRDSFSGDGKGKGQATSEEKECDELLEELKAKLEDLRQAPPQKDFIEESIAHLLGGSARAAPAAAPPADVVNVTSLVRKKPKQTGGVVETVKNAAASLVSELTKQSEEAARQIVEDVKSTGADLKAGAQTVAEHASELATELKDGGEGEVQQVVDAVTDVAGDAKRKADEGDDAVKRQKTV